MKSKGVVNFNKHKDIEHLSSYLAYTLSPVMKSIKPAELITLKNNSQNYIETWFIHRERILNNIGLSYIVLSHENKGLSILFYDKLLLEQTITQKVTNPILLELGYPMEGSFTEILEHLKYRFSLGNFPHEIGLFLGYPENDVESFIKHSGQNFNTSKYWKVYDNVEVSVNLFKQIDEIRDYAAKLLAAGIPINQTIQAIKAM